jgi:hypothetical protein
MNQKPLKFIYILTPILLILLYTYWYASKKIVAPVTPDIASFEECAAAGYPVAESYPEICRTPDGRSFTRVTGDTVPTPITATGTYGICLPKKDTGGPMTLECALGLQTETGIYALDTTGVLTENYPALMGNEKIIVEGVLVPKEMLSADRWQTYDVVGVIAVEKIIKR